MEQLKTTVFDISLHGTTIHCSLREKDFGDYIVYDVFSGGKYLVTISKQGDVLFSEASMHDPAEIMNPELLNELIEHLRIRINKDMH